MAARRYEISLRVLKNTLRKNDITRVDKNDIVTGGIAFLSICYHSVYH